MNIPEIHAERVKQAREDILDKYLTDPLDAPAHTTQGRIKMTDYEAKAREIINRWLYLNKDRSLMVESAIATALQEAAEGAWQPVETAPRDEMILALCFEDYPQAVHWDQEIDYGSKGIRQIWRSVLTDRFVMPTHWMPLPTPPKGESK
jgi:hypothetical protein